MNNDVSGAPSTPSSGVSRRMNHSAQFVPLSALDDANQQTGDMSIISYATVSGSRKRRSSQASSLPPTTPPPPMDDSPYDASSIYNMNSPHLAHEDEDILTHAISDAGLHAFGTIFVELWVVSSDGLTMTRPAGGHWMDPAFIQSVNPPEKAMEINDNAPNCAPGESLAGTLFRETGSRWGARNRKVYWRQLKSMIDDPFLQPGVGKRMEKIYELGIGLVATVPFAFQGRSGIVLFMSRSTACIDRLRAEENERYLIGATDLIGAAFAIRIPRMHCARVRQQLFRSAVEKVKRELRSKKPMNFADVVLEVVDRTRENDFSFLKSHDDSKNEAQERPQSELPPQPKRTSLFHHASKIPEAWKRAKSPCERIMQQLSSIGLNWAYSIHRKVENSAKKYRGAGLHGPPRHSLAESVSIFVGVFLVMLTLVNFNRFLREKIPEWTYDGGWYASSLCIIFALTAAPVGQPRQVLLAHTWCILVGYVCQKIPTGGMDSFEDYNNIPDDERIPGLPTAWKQAISTAVGISGQAYLGILHPPASGLAFTFASHDDWTLKNLLPVLIGDIIMVGMAMVILNLGDETQYPLFWLGLSWRRSTGEKEDPPWFKLCPQWLARKNQCKSNSNLRRGSGLNGHPSELNINQRWRQDDGDGVSEI